MTDEEYRKKQRLLIIFFTIGAIGILVVFIFTIRSHFEDLQINNPIDQIVDEDDEREIEQIRRSINELNQDFEELQEQETGNIETQPTEEIQPQQEQMDSQEMEDAGQEANQTDINEFLRQ